MPDTLDIVETLPPLHPGEVSRGESMVPLGPTAGKIAEARGVPRTRIAAARAAIGDATDTPPELNRAAQPVPSPAPLRSLP